MRENFPCSHISALKQLTSKERTAALQNKANFKSQWRAEGDEMQLRFICLRCSSPGHELALVWKPHNKESVLVEARRLEGWIETNCKLLAAGNLDKEKEAELVRMTEIHEKRLSEINNFILKNQPSLNPNK